MSDRPLIARATAELENEVLRGDVSLLSLEAIAYELSFRSRPKARRLAERVLRLIAERSPMGKAVLTENQDGDTGFGARRTTEVRARARARLGNQEVIVLEPIEGNRNDDLFALDRYSSGYLVTPNTAHSFFVTIGYDNPEALRVVLYDALRDVARLESARRSRSLRPDAERRLAAESLARAQWFASPGSMIALSE